MFASGDRPSWSTDSADWPNRHASRQLDVDGLRWHVQIMGEGPDVLLLHGTGASTHSWRDVAPLLARRYRLIVPDLPGHGFTGLPPSRGLSLPGMARSLGRLVAALDARPVAGIGHSAGAAILAAMALDRLVDLEGIVAINGALLPIRHASLFAPLARLLFLNPFAPRLFAMRASSRSAIARLIEGTGSHLDARGIDLYQRLMRRSGHVEGALGMMANWDLDSLRARLPKLDSPLVLIAAAGDRAVPPADAEAIAALVPGGERISFAEGGHLAHEEFPQAMADLLLGLLDRFAERRKERLSKRPD